MEEKIKIVFQDDFEKGMEILFQNNVDATWMQIALSKYFLQFVAGEQNVYLRLLDMLINRDVVYSFSTTNYELLIEQCLNQKELVPYYGIGIRQNSYNLISLLKIHGSPNFIPDANVDNFLMQGCVFPAKKLLHHIP
jgi:hypothetical protein